MRRFLFEHDYAERMASEIMPRLNLVRREGSFRVPDGTPLSYVVYDAPSPKGSVVILHGFTESSEKYRELIFYFLEAGLSVYLYDQRGHGSSGRVVEPGLVHVGRFAEYVDDFCCFLHTVAADSPSPRYLFSHSMGGAVAALYLERGEVFFDKAILNAPMIAPQHGELPLFLCRALCGTARVLGLGKRRVFAMKKPDQRSGFERSSTASRVRYEAYREIKHQNSAYRSNAATYAWTYAALGVTKRILAPGAPERIAIPVRLYAAEIDRLVQSEPQKRFIARVPKGEYCLVGGAKHEIYSANDEILHPYLEGVLSFFEKEEGRDKA